MTLTASQTANAHGIIAAVQARGWGIKAAYIAVETALTESGMRMIASANVPASQKYPYEKLSWTADGLGHDHASMGMFQQQTGTAWTPAGYGWRMNQTTINTPNGWGTPAALMNAQASTALFLNALSHHDWAHMTNWAAAQAVQGSAFANGSNYRTQDARAISIVNSLWAYDALMEEIMSYYPSKAAFETAMLELMHKAIAAYTQLYSPATKKWDGGTHTIATVVGHELGLYGLTPGAGVMERAEPAQAPFITKQGA